MTMPGDPSEGSGRQWVGHWYRRGHVTRRGYAIPPGWGEGTAEHTHTRHDGGGATTAYGGDPLTHVPVLPRKSTIRRSIGRSANRKPDSNAQGTLSTYSARITYMRSGGGGASGDERRHAGTAASGSRRRRASERTAASERANGGERASERTAASGGGRRHVFPYAYLRQ